MPDETPTPKSISGKTLNIILIVALLAIGAYLLKTESKRRAVESKLQTTANELEEIRKSTQGGGQQLADEVLAKVGKHFDLPTEPKPTVATIVDADRLKAASAFYAKAQNGNHLVITQNRAILYDRERDIIIDVAPVRLDQTASPSPAGTPTSTPRPTATPSPTPSPTS